MFWKPRLSAWVITVGLVVLCLGLGVWQVQRLAWKEGLIAQLETNSKKPRLAKHQLPKDLSELPQDVFRYVTLPGEFVHEHEFHLIGRSYQGQPGYDILTPFRIADDGRMILANRGWVPLEKKKPEDRPEDSRFAGLVFLSGMIVLPQKGSTFLPDHDVKDNIWFWYDIDRINQESGLDLPPVVVEVVNSDVVPGSLPIPKASKDVQLRNDHRGYALIWFSLAFAGMVIFFIYHLKEVREGKA